MGSPSGSLHSLVHIHNNFVALCFAYMKFACIYYHNQLPAASDFNKALLKEVGRRITSETGEAKSTEYLLQRLSVAVQRGNCASVLGDMQT